MTARAIVAPLVGLLLSTSCGGSAPASPARGPHQASPRSLYVNLLSDGWKLTRLDWSTLLDVTAPASMSGTASRQFPGNPYPQLLILATHR
jgi:hypothetical protein